jgi:hypothetical protein
MIVNVIKVVIARSKATCLNVEVPAFTGAALCRQALRHAGVAIL